MEAPLEAAGLRHPRPVAPRHALPGLAAGEAPSAGAEEKPEHLKPPSQFRGSSGPAGDCEAWPRPC